MAFEKKVPEWKAAGIEPPESLKTSGFEAGYKPPAAYFNWHMHGMGEAVKELQEKAATAENVSAHEEDKNNPHGVTASQVGAAPATHASQHGATGSDPITPAMIGAAASSHKHSASDVNGLSKVATTGSYNDLMDAPDIPDGVTVDSALSTVSTNPVQNKVVNTALSGKAPTSHASSDTKYGKGTDSYYGHVKLSDDTNSTSGASGGVAATPAAVKAAYDLANGKADSSHNQAASTITAGTFAGRVQGNASAMATLSNAQLRSISAGTSDLTAGTSALPTGTLYFVYE